MSVVYVIRPELGGPLKIGFVSHERFLKARLKALQNGNAYPLKIVWTHPGGRGLERELHEMFAKFRLIGEWFQDEPPITAYFGLPEKWIGQESPVERVYDEAFQAGWERGYDDGVCSVWEELEPAAFSDEAEAKRGLRIEVFEDAQRRWILKRSPDGLRRMGIKQDAA